MDISIPMQKLGRFLVKAIDKCYDIHSTLFYGNEAIIQFDWSYVVVEPSFDVINDVYVYNNLYSKGFTSPHEAHRRLVKDGWERFARYKYSRWCGDVSATVTVELREVKRCENYPLSVCTQFHEIG